MEELNALEPEADIAGTGETAPPLTQMLNRVQDRDKLSSCVKAIRKAYREKTDRIFIIGRELKQAKDILKHGFFEKWLSEEFGWTKRTAERYMQASTVFGAKSDIVSVLGSTAIYALSAKSTPEAVRKGIVAQLKAGQKLSPQAVKTKVAEAKKAAQAEKESLRASGDLDQPLPTVKKRAGEVAAQRAANFILENMGAPKASLTSLLKGVDAKMLVAALLKAEIVETKGLVSELAI